MEINKIKEVLEREGFKLNENISNKITYDKEVSLLREPLEVCKDRIVIDNGFISYKRKAVIEKIEVYVSRFYGKLVTENELINIINIMLR